MKKNIALFSIVMWALLVAIGCTKVADLPHYENGVATTLTSSTAAVAATPADSVKNVITFSWSDPKYATDSNTYKYIIEIDSSGRNFAKPTRKTVVGSRNVSFTGKELNAIILNYGSTLGVPYKLDVRVISSYSNNNERYISNILPITVTPYTDPSVLAASATSVTGTLATSSQNSLTFSWSPSFNGFSGAVNYIIQYDSAGKNFTAPQNIAVGNGIYSKSMTQKDMNTTALNSGIIAGTSGKVEYRIKAVTAAGAIAYSNVVFVTIQTYIPLLRFYMPGSYQAATGVGNNWDPGTAPEFIRDLRPGLVNKMYYAYMYLPAGAEFKITQGRDWAINYGGSGGTLSSGGANFSVATAGVYRISFDISTMQYDIRQGRMGFVGGATGAGWNPGNVFPTYAMGAPANNLFVGLSDFTTGGWKMIDNDQWNNGSNAVDETRSYGSTGGSGSTMEVNGANFPDISTAGRYRVIWDGRDPNNIKYQLSPANEMRVVGDGIFGVNAWDPSVSPQMTYLGNGQWQIININLIGGKEFKLLSGNAWGMYDYGDASGGSTVVGIPRKITGGGGNFKTPTVSGTYTILLDENAQTVTIN